MAESSRIYSVRVLGPLEFCGSLDSEKKLCGVYIAVDSLPLLTSKVCAIAFCVNYFSLEVLPVF